MATILRCKHCDKEVSVPANRLATFQYCSRSCKALATRVEVSANCVVCGSHFTHVASRANKAKYCSKPCYYKSLKGKGSVEHACRHCGTKFMDSPSKNRIYCSKSCVNKAEKTEWKATFSTVRKNMALRGLISQCVRCGYNAVPEILGVHHKDRDRKNNDLSNLEVLCPNCHSLEHMCHTPHGFKE